MGRGVGGFAIRLSCSVTPGMVGGGPTSCWAPASPTCPCHACVYKTNHPPLHTHPCTPIHHCTLIHHCTPTFAHVPLYIHPGLHAHPCMPVFARPPLYTHLPLYIHLTSHIRLMLHTDLPLHAHPCTPILSLNLLSKCRNPVQEKVYKFHLTYSEINSWCLWYPSIIWDPSMGKESSWLEPFLLFAVPL